MAMTQEEIRKLASLARIKLTPDEEQGLIKDMDNILSYIEQIKEVSSSFILDTPNHHDKEKVRNVMREDTNPHESGIYTEVLLQEVPHRDGQYVKVRKIL